MVVEPNSLYYGDCLDVLREWPDGVVDLCYLDPPFNSKTNYNILFGNRRGSESLAQVMAFEDTWRWDDNAAERVDAIQRATAHRAHDAITGLHIALGDCGMVAYLSYMAERLVEIRRVLKDTGSVYLHCDPTASHYLKVVMDAVFGKKSVQHGADLALRERVQGQIEVGQFTRRAAVVLRGGKHAAALQP